MVEIQAIRAFHSARPEADELACPVYDTMSETELVRFASLSPYNAARFVPRPRTLGLEDFVASASENLALGLGSGAYVQDPAPALYVYGIRYVPPPDITEALEPARRRSEYLLLGLVGALDLARLEHGQVALHEKTFADRVIERASLTDATAMSFAPILTGYHTRGHPLNDRLETLLGINRRELSFEGTAPPLVRATVSGTTHLLWRIDEPSEIARLVEEVRPLRLLVLDGHHRFTAAARRQYEGHASAPLVMLVDGSDRALQLLPWHRVLAPEVAEFDWVRDAALREFREVDRIPVPIEPEALAEHLHRMQRRKVRGFLLVGGNEAYEVRGPRSDDAGADFDLLHGFLDDHLEIDPEALQFVRSPRAALEAARAASAPSGPATSFLLPGLSLRAVEQRAFDRGEVMVQKSTMFLPKVAEGMLFARADPGSD